MKHVAVLIAITFVMSLSLTAFAAPSVAPAKTAKPATTHHQAQAKFSNVEKNIGRTVACPFKAAGVVITDLGKTLSLQKPTAVLAIPKEVRQQAFDMVESAGRTVANVKPIDIDGNGAVTNCISENGLDPVVDFAVYGVGSAVITHASMGTSAIYHHELPGKILAIVGSSVVAADIIDEYVEQK